MRIGKQQQRKKMNFKALLTPKTKTMTVETTREVVRQEVLSLMQDTIVKVSNLNNNIEAYLHNLNNKTHFLKEKTVDLTPVQAVVRDTMGHALQPVLTNMMYMEKALFSYGNELDLLHKRFDKIEAFLMHLPAIAEAEESRIAKEKEIEEKRKEMEAFLSTKIADLELSVRSHNALSQSKNRRRQKYANGKYIHIEVKSPLKTVQDLAACTEGELLSIPQFGRKSLNEVKELLASMGLRLNKSWN